MNTMPASFFFKIDHANHIRGAAHKVPEFFFWAARREVLICTAFRVSSEAQSTQFLS